MTAELIQISYSDLAAWHECPRRYFYEKRLRMGTLQDRTTTAVKRGTLMHTLLEGARDGCIDERQAAALFARERVADPREQEAILRAAHRVLSSAIYAEVSTGSDVRRERQFFLALHDEDGPARFLKGFIDIQSERVDGSLLIVDYKSGTRASVTERDYEDQARCYALVGLADGHPSVEVRFIRPEVDAGDGDGGAGEGDGAGTGAEAPAETDAPQVFSLGPYTCEDYDMLEAGLVAAIRAMEQVGPDTPGTPGTFSCAGCLISHGARCLAG